MDKVVKLYIPSSTSTYYAVPFPNSDNPVELRSFRYNATRMGGAPTITATFMYPTCLDDVWTNEVFGLFGGEKYYLKQTPTSSYSNTEALYKHEIDLVSERSVLENIYFYDTVTGDPSVDKPVSHSTKVVFFGTIQEFIERVQMSLAYCGLGERYNIVIDDDVEVSTEGKLVSFENKHIKEVLDEINNIYEIPYYFVGGFNTTTIHIGYQSDEIGTPFEYGVDNALLSISKRNDISEVVTKITGTGSTENIPYYYPNNSPKGTISAVTNRSGLGVEIVKGDVYAEKIELDGALVYGVATIDKHFRSTGSFSGNGYIGQKVFKYTDSITIQKGGVFNGTFTYIRESGNGTGGYPYVGIAFTGSGQRRGGGYRDRDVTLYQNYSFTKELYEGTYTVEITVNFTSCTGSADYSFDLHLNGQSYSWRYKGDIVELKDAGLKITSGTPTINDSITQRLVEYVNVSDRLMPSIYRGTGGAERFYKSITGGYTTDGYTVNYGTFRFPTPYDVHSQRELILDANDNIKPTIAYRYNAYGQRMDMFREVAFDQHDNNEWEEDESGENRVAKHSYFFVKLPRLGFNIFDCANEKQPMKIAMTSGSCGACEFEIGVDKDTQKNTVQVDANGNLVRDANGDVVCGREGYQLKVTTYQESQQDTTNNEVWIALKKEDDTFGILMPSAADSVHPAALRPAAQQDTYVILGISLPQLYITLAEEELERVIIKHLKEHNSEKISFVIDFSRIFVAENEQLMERLTENALCSVKYNGVTHSLYVNSYTYDMNADEPLPKISIDLGEKVGMEKNKIELIQWDFNNRLSTVISDSTENIAQTSSPFFVSKLNEDTVNGVLDFKKGMRFGEGGEIEIVDNNSAKLTIDYLDVRKKASFTSLEVKERTHLGGQLIVSPAAIKCNRVDRDAGGNYLCYFQTEDEDGGEIFNQFVVGDLAICQTFNTWGARYYWRRVIEVGTDFINLSYSNCDTGSDAPIAGDTIVQLGNGYANRKERQSAIVISTSGEGAPSWVVYNGINSFSLTDKAITGSTYNGVTNEPQFFNYGDMFFGDKDINDPNSQFITFQKKTGDTKKKLYIRGNVEVGANSTGLSNLTDIVNNITGRVDDVESSITESVSISGVEVSYIATSDGTTTPTSGTWFSTIAATGITNGKYLWTRTVINYTDGTHTTSYSASYYANDGDSGRGITSTVIEYGQSASGTDASTVSSWGTSIPSVTDGWYLWTRTTINYSSGAPSTSYSVSKDAQDGIDGKGIVNTVIEYAVSNNNVRPAESAFSTTMPTVGKGQYLWTRTTISYTEGADSVSYVVSYSGQDGADGQDGVDGTNGEDARIVAETDYYAISTDLNTIPDIDDFLPVMPTDIGQDEYLWTMHEIVWADGHITRTYTAVRNPIDGAKGEDGLNIAEVTLYAVYPKRSFSYTVTTPTGANYGFDELGTGEWESSNFGENNSASVALITIDMGMSGSIAISGTVSSETGCDQGILGKLNADIGVGNGTALATIERVVESEDGTEGEDYEFEQVYALPKGRSTIMVKYAKDGSVHHGSDSLRFIVRPLFAETPTKPSSALTYTFASGSLTGNLGGWSLTRPTMGADYLWQITARTASADATTVIQPQDWSYPVIIAYNNDMEYLADAFPFVQSVNGASIAQLIGVKGANENDPIVAGLNGSEIGADANHGKLLFFSGATSVQNGVVNSAKTKIYEDGHFVTDTGEFRGKIEADSGSIGGFDISNNHLGLEDSDTTTDGMSLYPSFIRLQSESGDRVATIGTDVMPAILGLPVLGYFNNSEQNLGDVSEGIIINVTGSDVANFAIKAKGNIVTNSLNTAYGVKVVNTEANTTKVPSYTHSVWLIKCTVDNAQVCLPTRSNVQMMLGIRTTETFCVNLKIIADALNSKAFLVQGRNSGIPATNNEQYPYRLNKSADFLISDGLSMSRGKVVEYQLVYDGEFYYAYLVGENN